MVIQTFKLDQPTTLLVVCAILIIPATISEARSTEPDYETMTSLELLQEMNKLIPESATRLGTVYKFLPSFSCKDNCGKMTRAFCSCRPMCVPAGNCCDDFRSECPLQYERLETDLWWLRHIHLTCIDQGIKVVKSCPSHDSPLHADHFTLTTKLSKSTAEVDHTRETTPRTGRVEPDSSSGSTNPPKCCPSTQALPFDSKAVDADLKESMPNSPKKDETQSLGNHISNGKENLDVTTSSLNSNVVDLNSKTTLKLKPEDSLFSSVLTQGKTILETSSSFRDSDKTKNFSITNTDQKTNLSTLSDDQSSLETSAKTLGKQQKLMREKSPYLEDNINSDDVLFLNKLNRQLADLFITDLHSGLVFSNVSVLECYEHLVKTPVYWTLAYRKDARLPPLANTVSLQTLAIPFMQKTVRSYPPEGTLGDLEFCLNKVVRSCPADYHNDIVNRRCRGSVAYLISEYDVYNNPFCAFCNGKSDIYRPLYFAKNKVEIVQTEFKFIDYSYIMMKLDSDRRNLRLVSLIKPNDDSGLLANWKEYVCPLVGDEGEETLENSTRSKVEPGNDVSPKTSLPGAPKPNSQTAKGTTSGILPSDRSTHTKSSVQSVSFIKKDCELQACRIGRAVRGRGCVAQVYFSIRLPPTPRSICVRMLTTMVWRIYQEINSEGEIMQPVSDQIDQIGSRNGLNIFQIVIVAESTFDLRDKSTLNIIMSVLSSSLISAGVKNGQFCLYRGGVFRGRLPHHAAHHCPVGNELALKRVIPPSGLTDIANVCSGQSSDGIGKLSDVHVGLLLIISLVALHKGE